MGMVVNPTCLYYAFRGDIDERQSLVSLTFPRSTFPNRIASKSFEWSIVEKCNADHHRCSPSAVHTLPMSFSTRISSALSIHTPVIYNAPYLLSFFLLFSSRPILFFPTRNAQFWIALLATDCLLCNEILLIYRSDLYLSIEWFSVVIGVLFGDSFIGAPSENHLSFFYFTFREITHSRSKDRNFTRRKFSKIEKFVSTIYD